MHDCVEVFYFRFLRRDGPEEFKLCRELILRVQPVCEIDSPNATVGVDLRGK